MSDGQYYTLAKRLHSRIPNVSSEAQADNVELDLPVNFITHTVETKGLFTLVTKGRDQSFSCIVIGGKVGAGPSSLYTIKSDQGLQWMKK
jgi:hypothetical protein